MENDLNNTPNEEKMLPQSKVNELVGKARFEGANKAQKEAEAEKEAYLTQMKEDKASYEKQLADLRAGYEGKLAEAATSYSQLEEQSKANQAVLEEAKALKVQMAEAKLEDELVKLGVKTENKSDARLLMEQKGYLAPDEQGNVNLEEAVKKARESMPWAFGKLNTQGAGTRNSGNPLLGNATPQRDSNGRADLSDVFKR